MSAIQAIKPRRKAMPKIQPSVIAIYASIFVLIVAMVSIGYHEPQSSSVVSNAASVNSLSQPDQTSVDNVVATSVAAGVAQITNLPIATSVANLAVSAQTKGEFAQSSGANTTKPQIIESGSTNRLATSYITKADDTVGSLAIKFGISAQTINWANNLTSDSLSEGSVLQIPPVDSIIYTVKSGDTIDSIVKKYGVDKTRLILYNDLDLATELTPNSKIILPSGTLPEDERPGYVAPYVAPVVYYSSVSVSSGGNGYAMGYCTWYASERRMQMGIPISGSLGNANSWAYRSPTGYDHEPSVGAVLVDEGGWLGHVAVVESVTNDSIVISEMNNSAYGGWNRVNNRTISHGQAVLYKYIH